MNQQTNPNSCPPPYPDIFSRTVRKKPWSCGTPCYFPRQSRYSVFLSWKEYCRYNFFDSFSMYVRYSFYYLAYSGNTDVYHVTTGV